MSGWLDAPTSQGLLSEDIILSPNAVTTLDVWFSKVCLSSSTKVQVYLDNMHFDSDRMAHHLNVRPSSTIFALIKP